MHKKTYVAGGWSFSVISFTGPTVLMGEKLDKFAGTCCPFPGLQEHSNPAPNQCMKLF